jgi:hypothetical protein
VDGASTVHAEVRGDAELSEGRSYRLVVQSYDAAGSPLPGDRARPIGSLQRAVTGDELRRGVSVSLVELRQLSAVRPKGRRGPVLLAWVEAGAPDLDFDGRMARPRPGSMYGVVKRSAAGRGRVQIHLNRKLAA